MGKTPPRAADGFVQYDFIEGFARHMRDALPHGPFVGSTGTLGCAWGGQTNGRDESG